MAAPTCRRAPHRQPGARQCAAAMSLETTQSAGSVRSRTPRIVQYLVTDLSRVVLDERLQRHRVELSPVTARHGSSLLRG